MNFSLSATSASIPAAQVSYFPLGDFSQNMIKTMDFVGGGII
jgi:hypothetical protein